MLIRKQVVDLVEKNVHESILCIISSSSSVVFLRARSFIFDRARSKKSFDQKIQSCSKNIFADQKSLDWSEVNWSRAEDFRLIEDENRGAREPFEIFETCWQDLSLNLTLFSWADRVGLIEPIKSQYFSPQTFIISIMRQSTDCNKMWFRSYWLTQY